MDCGFSPRQQEVRMLRILIEDSEGKSKLAPINPEANDITIGRKEGNFIRLKERNVSRYHARIFSTPEGLFIEPVAARYGLKLNSTKIEGKTPIALGDEIRIGDYRLYIQDENKPDVRKEENLDSVVDIDPTLQPRLVVISSNFAGREYHIMRSKVTIGRNPNSDIQIQHQSVSGQHAEIRRTPRGDYEIRDLNSSNGTKVNGVQISEPFRLGSGDAVTLGHVTMRYCGPGDFWTLNFGINDEPAKNAMMPIIVAGAAVLVILLLAIVIIFKISNNNPTPQVITQPATSQDDSASKEDEFLKNLKECTNSMKEGSFDMAQIYCDKAEKIIPSDPRWQKMSDQLHQELMAKNAYEDARTSLSAHRCRDAMDAIENITPDTWAYREMMDKNLKSEAHDCQENKLLTRALESIKNENILDAELAREEIRTMRSDSPNIEKIDEAIRKAKSSKATGGTSGSPKTRPSQVEAAQPPKPAAPDPTEMCANATKAKMAKDYCGAYKLYKKIKNMGYPNDTCKRAGESLIEQYAGKCAKQE